MVPSIACFAQLSRDLTQPRLHEWQSISQSNISLFNESFKSILSILMGCRYTGHFNRYDQITARNSYSQLIENEWSVPEEESLVYNPLRGL